jgi:putative transcriptional regulator
LIRLRVRDIAEEQGLRVQDLATKTGISYSTIIDLWYDRTRRIDKRTLDRLCRTLGVTPGDLFTYDPSEEEIGEPDLVAGVETDNEIGLPHVTAHPL